MNKQKLIEEKKALQPGSIGVALLPTTLFVTLCFAFKNERFLLFGLFVWFLSYTIAQRHRYKKLIANLILDKTISKPELNKLINETNPEEENYFSTKGIALWVLGGMLTLAPGVYGYVKTNELNNHSAYAIGRVYEINDNRKSPCASIEFYVNNKRYTTSYRLIYSSEEYSYIYRNLKVGIKPQIGDEFKIRYSGKDPGNCEPEIGPPINR